MEQVRRGSAHQSRVAGRQPSYRPGCREHHGVVEDGTARRSTTNTEKGRNNREALRRLADSSGLPQTNLHNTGAKTKDVDRYHRAGARAPFIKTARSLGATKEGSAAAGRQVWAAGPSHQRAEQQKVGITISANASEVAKNFGVILQGSSASAARRRAVGEAREHIGANLDSVIGAPVRFPKGHPAAVGHRY